MTRVIDKKQFRSMNAYIKYFDNGAEIFQSWSTDVVLRKKNGELVRLWAGWSVMTNKQVKAYCGKSLRDIPFEDGTFEETKHSLNVWGLQHPVCRDFTNVKKSKMTPEWFFRNYGTGYGKQIKKLIGNDKELNDIYRIAHICALANKKIKEGDKPEPRNKYQMYAYMYDYNFCKIYNINL